MAFKDQAGARVLGRRLKLKGWRFGGLGLRFKWVRA